MHAEVRPPARVAAVRILILPSIHQRLHWLRRLCSHHPREGRAFDRWPLLQPGRDVPTIQEWTADQAEGGKVVGVDPSVVTAADARKLADKIKKKGGQYKAIDENLVDLVWGAERPTRPSEKVIVQPVEYSGKSFDEKIEDLRKELEKKKSLGFVVSMLDETAWLLNLRGNE
jgi:Xaa-Pro aminopeptidase